MTADPIQAAKERLTIACKHPETSLTSTVFGDDLRDVLAELSRLDGENERLRGLLNSPETEDFMRGVPLEAAHQVERWGADHDAGKEPLDWFWLIGYLAQKATTSALAGDLDKAKHHTISTAGALANWHAQLSGKPTAMRPGVDADERRFSALLSAPSEQPATQEEGSSQDPGHDQCGEQPEAAVGATAALAEKPAGWRYEFSAPRQEDGYRDGSTVWHVGFAAEPPSFPVRNLKPLYEREGSNA